MGRKSSRQPVQPVRRLNLALRSEDFKVLEKVVTEHGAPTLTETVLRAARLYLFVADRLAEGDILYTESPSGKRCEIVLPELYKSLQK